MTKETLDQLARLCGQNLSTLMGEMQDEILEAASVALETAQEEGKEAASVTLSHSIKINLAKPTFEESLAVSVRHKHSMAGDIPNPNQPELFEGEEA